MFQFLLSVNVLRKEWTEEIKRLLDLYLVDCVCVTETLDKRCQLAVASERADKTEIYSAIAVAVAEVLASYGKYEFLKKEMRLPIISTRKHGILLHALTRFDYESDMEIIKDCFCVTDGMTIDGIYNFKLGKVKERWRELIALTKENAVYFGDDDIFYELIKFLFASIEAKVKSVIITAKDDKFIIRDAESGKCIHSCKNVDDTLCALVDYAPVSVSIEKAFNEKSAEAVINKIFCAQPDYSGLLI